MLLMGGIICKWDTVLYVKKLQSACGECLPNERCATLCGIALREKCALQKSIFLCIQQRLCERELVSWFAMEVYLRFVP